MRRFRAAFAVLAIVGPMLISSPAGGRDIARDDVVDRSDQGSAPAGPGSALAGRLSSFRTHTCAVLDDGAVRCWGTGTNGQLGYGNTENIGDDETPDTAGPVDLGPGRTATAIATGLEYSCALLDNGTVRCWGVGTDGRLGYGNTDHIGDNESPGSVGPVDL
ncbi:MAG: hypothetical protein OEU32_14460, partial [Acidimicrobiia bacterium]|nr:hypothetical protein [Acidimicrobiia bacterium]